MMTRFGWLILVGLLSGCLGGGGGGSSEETTQTAATSLALLPGEVTATGEVQLTAVVKDKNFIPLAGEVVTFGFSGDNHETLSPSSGETGGDGTVAVTVTDLEQNGGSATVVARTGRLTATATVTFRDPAETGAVLNDATEGLVITPSNLLLPVDGVAEFEVLVLDGSENPIANSPVAATLTDGSLDAAVKNTDSTGRARFQVRGDGTARNATFRATSGVVVQAAPVYFGAYAELTPSQGNASRETTLRALVKDGLHAPLPNQTVNFRFAGAGSETLDPPTGQTGTDGTLAVKITDLDENGGQVTVIAQAGEVSDSATVNFLAPLGQGSTLDARASAQVMGGSDIITLTAEVVDQAGVPIAGQPITFSLREINDQPVRASLSADTGVTNQNGQTSITIQGAGGENLLASVRTGSAVQEIPLYFGASIDLAPRSATASVGSDQKATLTATVKDATGAGIPGTMVQFRSASQNALLSAYQKVTNGTGQAQITVTNQEIEEIEITAHADLLPRQSAAVNFLSLSAKSPKFILIEAEKNEITVYESTQISVTVLDLDNNPVADGTPITFSSNIGNIIEKGFTKNGEIQFTFNALGEAGIANISALYKPIEDPRITFYRELLNLTNENDDTIFISEIESGVTITILPLSSVPGDPSISPEQATSIELDGVTSSAIGIAGTGVPQTTELRFRVKNQFGNSIEDGTEVTFTLGTTSLNGGETLLDVDGSAVRNVTKTTAQGVASVILRSGAVAGTVDVVAEVNGLTATGRVSIVGGMPDADHLGIATEFLNLNSQSFGLESFITAYVGDRFGNVVPDGTRVNFISEGGTIGQSQSTGAFTATTVMGRATAILQTTTPTTPNLTGVAPASNPGWNRIVAFTTGSESFVDVNGNGSHDPGEPFTPNGDLSEPYIDGNDNGAFDAGELYIDVDNDGRFDGPDGVYQDNTTIWTSMNVLFSVGMGIGEDGPCLTLKPLTPRADGTVACDTEALTPNIFTVHNGGLAQNFYLYNLNDVYGNSLVSGTTVKVSTTAGVLGGTTELTIPDRVSPGAVIQFTLASKPATPFTEQVENDDGTTQTVVGYRYPSPANATVTVQIRMPSNDEAPGGRGQKIDLSLSGIINQVP